MPRDLIARNLGAGHALPPTMAARLLDVPLLLDGRAFDRLVTAAAPHAAVTSQGGHGPASGYFRIESVAVVPVYGFLLRRGTGDPEMDAWFGLQAIPVVVSAIREAMADSAVESVVLDIDSPGSETHGIFDAADAIFALRNPDKPLIAFANEWATSGAYLLASAADEVHGARMSVLGSIGVITSRVDVTSYDEKVGVRYEVFATGENKTDGHPHVKLEDDERERISTRIERAMDLFATTVSRNRPKLTVEAIRAQQAAIYQGVDAVEAGLADRIHTLEDLVMELATNPSRPQRRSTSKGGRMSTTVVEIDQARADGATRERARLAEIRAAIKLACTGRSPEQVAAIQSEGEKLLDDEWMTATAAVVRLAGVLVATAAAPTNPAQPAASVSGNADAMRSAGRNDYLAGVCRSINKASQNPLAGRI